MPNKISESEKKALSKEVDDVVEKFINEYSWIKNPIMDSYETIEKLGFFIIGKSIDNKISGFQVNIGDYKCIFVNRSHGKARQNQSLWHEVYHWYTGETGYISKVDNAKYDKMEFKAENFASKILINRSLLKEKALQRNKDIRFLSRTDLIELQNYFKASYMNIAVSLKELFPNEFNDMLFNIGIYKNQPKLINLCKENDLDYSLLEPSKTDYISPSFISDLQQNYTDNKINDEYITNVLDFLEKELSLGE